MLPQKCVHSILKKILRMTKVRRKIILILVLICLCILVFVDFDYPESELKKEDRPKEVVVNENNYLEIKGSKSTLVDMPGCIIPMEIDLNQTRNKSDINYKACYENQPQFTYVRGNRIFIKSTFKEVSCCYKGIHRKFGNDHNIFLADNCVKIANPSLSDEGTEVVNTFDAVNVICIKDSKMFAHYHPVVHHHKFRFNSTHNFKTNSNVPNIIILGLDSVSKYHFHTLMTKTRTLLKKMGSVEMLGYTKVGENTFPNAIVFSTGYSEEEVKTFCYSRWEPIDNCPFIWKHLNMNTAYLEDATTLSHFNYFKFGFFHPPANHYLRPLMLAASEHDFPYSPQLHCVGSQSTESFILDHIEQLLLNQSPIFIFTWLTGLAHDNVDLLPAADLLISKFIEKQDLENTIFILMSDHGHRYGDDRRTFNGWFNEKLPFFTITLPPKVKEFLGDKRMQNLESNINKLTSPYEVYHTLRELLIAYSVLDEEKEKKNDKLDKEIEHFLKNRNSNLSFLKPQPPRTHGQSLFSIIPNERSCFQAGIPQEFCACYDLQAIDMKDPLIQQTVVKAVERINSWIPRRCKRLKVDQIIAAARMNEEEFIVGFTTMPGDFKFETRGWFHERILDPGPDIIRTDAYGGVWCSNNWFIDKYCYCHLSGLIAEYIIGN